MNDSDASNDQHPKELTPTAAKQRSWFSLVWKWSRRASFIAIASIIAFAFAAWILGNTPINNDFQHASATSGIDVIVINNGIHADLVLPVRDPAFRWLDYLKTDDFPEFDTRYDHAVFGWGNRKFYMETETWNDVKVSNILFAFAGLGETVVHVDLCSELRWSPERSRKIRVSADQFRKLSEQLLLSFKRRSDGSLIPVPRAHYSNSDAFYEGNGHYHLFRTCNVWAGGVLAKGEVRVGYWTLTPGLLFACLPEPPRNQE